MARLARVESSSQPSYHTSSYYSPPPVFVPRPIVLPLPPPWYVVVVTVLFGWIPGLYRRVFRRPAR